MPRYEDYGTYIRRDDAIVGAFASTINPLIDDWLSNAKVKVLAQEVVESTKFFLKTGLPGAVIGASAQAIDVTINSDGDISLIYNTSKLNVGNILVDTGATFLIAAGILGLLAAADVAIGVVALVGVSIGASLLWSGITGGFNSVQDIITDSNDIQVRIFTDGGTHVASYIYPEGQDYPDSPAEAVQGLLFNFAHAIPNNNFTINISGGSDSGAEFKIDSQPYQNIAGRVGVSVDNMMSVIHSPEYDNSNYTASNAVMGKVYYYPTNYKLKLVVPVVIDGVTQNILVNNIYDSTGKIAGIDSSQSTDSNLILAAAGNSNVFGTTGKDLILGSSGNNTINGIGGSDIIFGYGGNDIIHGGVGVDNILVGGSGDDQLFGHGGIGGTSSFYGDGGNDIIVGSDGNDLIRGGADNDTLTGGIGNDIMDGGAGYDTIKYEASFFGLIGRDITLSERATVPAVSNAKTSIEVDLMIDVERVEATSASDNIGIVLLPTTKVQEIHAGDGDDEVSVVGSLVAFKPTIYLENGDDTLLAAPRGSIVYGGSGADTFELGSDYLIADADTGDTITYGGRTIHGGINFNTQESPWAKGLYGVRYGRNEDGELVIVTPDGRQTFVANFNFDLAGERTAGLLVGEGSSEFYRLLDSPKGFNLYDTFEAIFGYYMKAISGISFFPGIDPLILDMDGDGVELNARLGVSPFYDIDADGFAEQTGWARGDDAFLVRDLNANGIIDDASEMFVLSPAPERGSHPVVTKAVNDNVATPTATNDNHLDLSINTAIAS
ncbi:MAG: calcium-binding protein [Rickettsiales bacterium]